MITSKNKKTNEEIIQDKTNYRVDPKPTSTIISNNRDYI